jgi:hypothetical protein
MRGNCIAAISRLSILAFSLFFLFLGGHIAHGLETITIKSFENSDFYKKYKIKEKSSWNLNSGGRNFYYSYTDPDNPGQSFSLELSHDPSNIKSIGIVWHGLSISDPATFTPKRQQFLKDLLLTIDSKFDSSPVLSYIKNQQKKNYPGGSNAMPRKKIGNLLFYGGIVGSDLVLGIEK